MVLVTCRDFSAATVFSQELLDRASHELGSRFGAGLGEQLVGFGPSLHRTRFDTIGTIANQLFCQAVQLDFDHQRDLILSRQRHP